MSSDTVPNISILVSGKAKSLVLEMLTKVKGINLNIICSNLLDYELENEDFQPIKLFPWELVTVLKQTTENVKEAFPIPSKIKEELLEHIPKGNSIEEEDLHILYNINQIETVSKNIESAYEILEGQIGKNGIKLFPISDSNPNLLAIRQKRWSPLRYYLETGELLFDLGKLNGEEGKKKKGNKSLEIEGLDRLESIKLNDKVKTVLEQSDLVIFVPTDIISLEVFLKAKNLNQQVQKLSPLNKLVIIWNPSLISDLNEREIELSTLLDFENFDSLDKFFADVFDYVVIDKNASEDELKRLYNGEIKVISEIIPLEGQEFDDYHKISHDLVESLFNIANLNIESNFGVERKEVEPNDFKTTISINEIREEEHEGSNSVSVKEETPVKTESKVEVVPEETTSEKAQVDEPSDESYSPPEDLSFEESIKATIEEIVENRNEQAQLWLQNICSKDSDQEVVVASILVSKWIETEAPEKKRDIGNLINLLYLNHKQSYEQILTQRILNKIANLDEDYITRIANSFKYLRESNIELCEKVIQNILHPISIPNETNPVITELGKVTLLQMVLGSKRLSRVAISGLLNILDAKSDPSPEIWNILTAFNAAMVGIELIINFSIDRAEELIRRSPLLRYSGSFITTINKIMVYWKEGDNNAIARITGSVLPPQMVRKLERIDLARKIKKLRVVPLSTLAETLNIDPKKLEVMIAELVMKDDLDIKMEVLDNRMVIVYEGTDADED